ERLNVDPERPWADYRHGKPLTAKQLGALLKPFGITSVTVHPRGQPDAKGYHWWQFKDAWESYLPPEGPENPRSKSSTGKDSVSETSMRPNADEAGASAPFSKRPEGVRGRIEKVQEMPMGREFGRSDGSEDGSRPEKEKKTEDGVVSA